MKVSRIFITMLGVVLLCGGVIRARAASTGERYFPETGHWVRQDFLKFYEAAGEPTLVYGYPITEGYADARSGLTVQYFQRARFELHPAALDGKNVRLTPVGSLLYTPEQNPKLDITQPLACRQFPEAGFPVCYGFLEFFNDHGGVEQFGYPISGFEAYNGRIVQYFENARLEWYPELGEDQKVRPADLGRTYFDSIPEDSVLLEPALSNFAPQRQVQELQARAFVQKAVTRGTDRQEIYVVVQDQTLRPVAGAAIVLTVRWPDGTQQMAALRTDNNGLAAAAINFADRQPGELVILKALVSYQDLTSKASGSFRVWH